MEKNMLTFAMTTTTKLAGLSLYEKDKLLGEIHVEMAKTHSTTILEQIDSLLKWTGKKLGEIENVIVSIGPGSFTGVRIAISVIKGIFFGKNVNFYEVNELDALGFQGYYNLKINLENEENVKIYSLIDSRKEKVYCAAYEIFNGKAGNRLKLVKNYEVMKLDNVIEEIIENKQNGENNKKIYLIGDAVFNYKVKILDKLGDFVRIFEDKNLAINTMTYVEMFLDENFKNDDVIGLKKTVIFNLKPDYLEKSQAERDKK
ncbi:tRNA (adenosine(37)-N6)-threonylcarbamoyltransferase complex dimerization subunit type 1 TsaB [Leptotrichia wadei]|nr:tRNA (adenosine(37)-N6)-threonylcarbamoyltransferase complex dimerization subunit type 1 TsaB [Leptotrichia wadei]